jgi:hypothetical protein
VLVSVLKALRSILLVPDDEAAEAAEDAAEEDAAAVDAAAVDAAEEADDPADDE